MAVFSLLVKKFHLLTAVIWKSDYQEVDIRASGVSGYSLPDNPITRYTFHPI